MSVHAEIARGTMIESASKATSSWKRSAAASLESPSSSKKQCRYILKTSRAK